MTGEAFERITTNGKLQHVTRNGTHAKALCPAHPDRNPSLSISRSDDGVLINCLAGCTQRDVIAAANLTADDLYDTPKRKRNEQPPAEWYPYADADGVVRYYKRRWYTWDDAAQTWRKTFMIYHADRRMTGMPPGQQHLLYRLPEVLAAVAAGETVFVVEGEKDADALVGAGVYATSGDGGAANWRNVADSAAVALKGATVVVVADRDTPGYECAKEAAASLAEVAANVAVVEALAPHKDAAEHVAAGHGVGDFVVLASGDGVTSWNVPQKSRKDGHFLDWDELYNSDTNDETLVHGLWPLGRHLQIYAARKTGKSLVMLWIAVQISRGFDPFTGESQAPRRVAYYDYEMSAEDIRDRLMDMGFQVSDLGNLFYDLYPILPPLDTEGGGRALLQIVEDFGIEVVVIDTVTRAARGGENENDTFRDLYWHTILPLKRAGVSSGRLDHEGHDGSHARGASTKAEDVDISWRLRTSDDGLRFDRQATRLPNTPERIEVRKHLDPLRFDTTAQRSWPEGTARKARELDEVDVPLDATRKLATEMLEAAGLIPGTTAVLAAALRFRRTDPMRGFLT